MAFKAANPVTLGKKRKKILFLCRSYPWRSHLAHLAALFATREEPRPRLVSSYFLSLYSWCCFAIFFSLILFYFIFFFYAIDTDPFLGHPSSFVWSSPNPLVSKFFLFFRAFNKCQQSFHGPYLNFSVAATVLSAR